MALYKDYDSVVKKYRRARAIKRVVVACSILAVACIATIIFVHSPKDEKLIGQLIVAKDVDTNLAAPLHSWPNQLPEAEHAEIERVNQYPGWKYSSKDEIKITSVGAGEYVKSSNGLYLPRIQLTCERLSFGVNFIVDEIISTEVARIRFSSDLVAETEQKWNLSETYRIAHSPDPVGFINMLSAANSLSVTYQTFGDEQTKTSEFDLSYSMKAIGEFRSQCAMESPTSVAETSEH